MASRLNDENEDVEEGKGADMAKNPMEELAALEARFAMRETKHDASIEELRKDIADLKVQIGDLVGLLDALKNVFKFIKMLEGLFIFTAKMGGAIGIIYATWKFGLQELAVKVKSMGGN